MTDSELIKITIENRANTGPRTHQRGGDQMSIGEERIPRYPITTFYPDQVKRLICRQNQYVVLLKHSLAK